MMKCSTDCPRLNFLAFTCLDVPMSFLLLFHQSSEIVLRGERKLLADYLSMMGHICPVNQHPLFLFWKPGSVCDPEKNWAPTQKSRMQKTKVGVIQKEKKQPVLFSFWITMTLFFCTLLFCKKQGPWIFKSSRP